MSEPGKDFDWAALVTQLVHPTKVTVVEAMLWIDQPLSATDLARSFDGEFGISHISYHLKSLAKVGVLKSVGQRQVRGATETFYFFAGR
jgi:DNA-binding transcriptional ArsR family regulator